MLRTYSFRSQPSRDHAIPEAAAADGAHHGRASWFDPLYIEDPLRPSNNVGRNCFRIYAIQQEFCKAHQQTTMPGGDYAAEGEEYPILARICKMLSKIAR